jgi:DNA topoisomerase-1
LAAYEDIVEDKNADEEVETRLPAMSAGDKIEVDYFEPLGHETKPPARYTEPSLVKKLEELGIGRPSTFASTIQTIQDRGYVAKRGRALIPSFLAFSVTGLLEQHFGKLVDYDFTASMEEDLDKIALGEEDRVSWLKRLKTKKTSKLKYILEKYPFIVGRTSKKLSFNKKTNWLVSFSHQIKK